MGTLFVGLSQYFMVLAPKEISRALDFIISKSKEVSADERSAEYLDFFGDDILRFAVTVIGLYLLMGFFMYCMRKTIIVVSRLIEYDIRKEIYEHYQSLDFAFYKKNLTGDLMARISQDVTKVRMYLGPGLMYGIRVTFLVVFVIFAMIRVNPQLTMFALLPLPFLSLSIYYVSSIINKRSDIIQKQIANLNSISQEVYSGIRIVKSYVKEKEFSEYFKDESIDYKNKALDLARVNALFFPLMILLMNVSTLLTVYVGGKLYAQDQITMGNLLEFIIYIGYLNWPITSIGWIASIIQQAEASQNRINEVLKVDPEIKNISKDQKTFEGSIEFKNVSFTYPDTGIQALKNVSFKVNPGEKLAIVGRTASGKSTIADLLLRFYDVTKGEILIDGINIKELNLFNLRSNVGYIPQNVFLFSTSIEDNVRFGKNEAELDAVKQYSEYAAIHKDISELPDGYSTMVGERGVTLSGGQKQRVSIARALIKNPDIILFDDSLSALDANTEHKILNYLNEVLENKTSIIVTHRISPQLKFDKILVLESGEIEDFGSHDELIKKDGYYSQIIEKQS